MLAPSEKLQIFYIKCNYSSNHFYICHLNRYALWFKVRLFIIEIILKSSSCPEVFFKKGVLKNFAKFTGKNLCQSLFFNKVAGLNPATLLK